MRTPVRHRPPVRRRATGSGFGVLVPLVLALFLTGTLAGCSAAQAQRPGHPADRTAHTPAAASPGRVRLPDAGASFDYQLGGPYRPPAGVRAVSRDRTARPATGLYSLCYVNAFQAQPGAASATWWRSHHPELLLREGHDPQGAPVVDEDWDEPLFDISTPAGRTALLGVVGGWIDGCAHAGFAAVEPDNLDSYQRSKGLLRRADAVAFAGLLARRAHRDGLAVAQKNTGELLGRRRDIGFDFAVVEECAHYDECAAFSSAYDRRVFDIEYDARSFAAGCRRWGRTLSITLRDRDVLPAGEPGHRDRRC
ncbi:endo alpha-1,4 polygalactosaminidase [Streptomyces sp. NBC_01497]|uniref:endo alpha-1,4 polygalactosaminidase n=1 Tax=Streptomyces sp. NBC_01497 TaxID=2903885 RepID=UPI002E32E8CA|nr:endo alpha-1,4 polygalactosaminidase [Streptomyces sp. NBC_01497]